MQTQSTIQIFENLPEEIKTSNRFFAVTEDKRPITKNWSNPDNQTSFKTIQKAKALAGLDTCGHDIGVDYFFLDFDHVLNNGAFVTDSAEKTIADLQKTFPEIYIEKSISGHGLHAFLIPTANKFGMFAAGSKGTIYFSESREKNAPKLEIFYKSKARYCLVTGNIYGKGTKIPNGDSADKYLNRLISKIAVKKKVIPKSAVPNTEDFPEYVHDLAVALWNYGDFANFERSDWLPCVSALKNLGFSVSEVKSMCEGSSRYNENAFETEFNSLTDISTFGIETLIGKCPNFDFKSFKKQWYQNHVQFDSQYIFDEDLKKFIIPTEYKITKNTISKISVSQNGETKATVISPRKIFIKEQLFNVEDKTYKLVLAHKTATGVLKAIPAQNNATIFNKNKIVDLANFGLPVTSSNATKIVDWLFAFNLANEENIPLTYTVNRCGWYTFNDTDYFIDPRRNCSVEENGKNIEVVVDSSACQFANSLTTRGTLEEWKRAYLLAKNSPVARLTVAAAIAAPLLKLLNERNFVFYVHGKTRSGKSTALYLGASAVGKSDIVRTFDSTNNGLIAMAADTNDYSFFVDEKQAADPKLQKDFQRFIYSVANGIERARATKEGRARTVREWQNILICNGETELLNDNATGGAHTRLLSIAAPDETLNADICKKIRDIIKNNYGHITPLFIDHLFRHGFDQLKFDFQKLCDRYINKYPNILPDYCRYMAILTLADTILNIALGFEPTQSAKDSVSIAQKVLQLIPTLEEIDDTTREVDFVMTFITTKAAHFEGDSNFNKDRGLDVYGKYDYDKQFLFVISTILNKFLDDAGYNSKKVSKDLINSGIFKSDIKVEQDRENPRATVKTRIGGKPLNCYRIPIDLLAE